MTKARGIYYIGQDAEFFNRLQTFAIGKKLTLKDTFFEQYLPGSLVSQAISLFPSIVFVDFKYLDNYVDDFFSELIYLKKIDSFKSILFISLFSNKEELEEYSYAFTSGFQLSFIKGCEENILFANSFYIGYGERNSHAQYVKVKNIDLQMKLGFCSTLTAISTDSFVIETDVPATGPTLPLRLEIFPELNAESFNIRKRMPTNYLYPMIESLILDFPIAGAWDATANDNIKKEKIEEWLELNSVEFEKFNLRIHVVTKNKDLILPLYNSVKSTGIAFELQENLNIETLFDELSLKRPHLIFLDLEEASGSENNLENFSYVTSSVRVIENYNPIIIITNNDSKSEAIQNIYNYKSLIIIPQSLTIDIFSSLSNKLLERKSAIQPQFSINYFSKADRRRSIDVNHDVIISSLSELEISFYAQFEIPMYSVLHLSIPLECYATVVPFSTGQKKEPKGWCYTAFIHGLSERELAVLRKFINQILYKPLQQFSLSEVEYILSRKEPPKIAPEALQISDTLESIESTKANNFGTLNRIQIKGKTKL
jgi:hypothetical protein